ncbi:creatininase [Tissierella creatinophila]|uniref:Creatinine amidohydrolase n=1 Tax=Tissierella creatinophila DSM 6911 TaxID=1123403 RepID=A0A1U7M4H9_TISCR|nr:creatininase [Tissierella creatinophila]OLS02224.1 creatinine amidohydrolase [Tissierella creatinophila DSM 6911]
MKNLFIENMTWEEYANITEENVLIIPIGATEQHSRHLPLSVDNVISVNFAQRLAKELNGFIAPALSYGYKSNPTSGGGPLFPGTIDLNGNTLTILVQDILNEFIKDGWKKIILLNSHYENQAFLAEAADLVIKDQQEEFPKIVLASWWDNISEDVMPQIFDERPFRGWDLEHAAITETSLMMYFEPDLVKNDLLTDEGIENVPRYQRYPVSKTLIPKSGALYTSISSTPEKGKIIVDDVVDNFLVFFREEFSLEELAY